MYDVLIIGAGPSGLNASIHATFEGLSTCVIYSDKGQMLHTGHIQNVAGISTSSITGKLLWQRMHKQAVAMGVTFVNATCNALERLPDGTIEVRHDKGSTHAKNVVLALGKQFIRMPQWENQGVELYYGGLGIDDRLCDKNVVIVGGSNAACQGAIDALNSHAKTVTVLNKHHCLEDKASCKLVQELDGTSVFVYNNTEVSSVMPHSLIAVDETNGIGQYKRFDLDILLVCIGQKPHMDWLPSTIQCDNNGYIMVRYNDMSTSLNHIYAIGDCTDIRCERISCAMGDGARFVAGLVKEVKD